MLNGYFLCVADRVTLVIRLEDSSSSIPLPTIPHHVLLLMIASLDPPSDLVS